MIEGLKTFAALIAAFCWVGIALGLGTAYQKWAIKTGKPFPVFMPWLIACAVLIALPIAVLAGRNS